MKALLETYSLRQRTDYDANQSSEIIISWKEGKFTMLGFHSFINGMSQQYLGGINLTQTQCQTVTNVEGK